MKDINRGHVDFDEVCRRLRGEVTQMRRQGFEEKELSDKLKALESVDQRGKKKRLERVNKVKEPNKKLEEMQNFKLKTASTSHDQAKVNNMKEKKNEKEHISSRRSVSLQKSSLPVAISKNKSQKGSDRKKNQKLNKESFIDSLYEEDVEIKHDETQLNQSFEDECDKMITTSSTAVQILTKEETNDHVDQFGGISLSDFLLLLNCSQVIINFKA